MIDRWFGKPSYIRLPVCAHAEEGAFLYQTVLYGKLYEGDHGAFSVAVQAAIFAGLRWVMGGRDPRCSPDFCARLES
jgi:hypothetical protein